MLLNMLSFDSPPDLQKEQCQGCRKKHRVSTAYVLRDGEQFAHYKAHMYGDHGYANNPMLFFEVFFADDWDVEPLVLTIFGSGVVAGQEGYELGLLDPDDTSDVPNRTYLTRAQALEHQWLRDNWRVTDFAMASDPYVHKFLYGHKPRA